jgi:hypothetical protein
MAFRPGLDEQGADAQLAPSLLDRRQGSGPEAVPPLDGRTKWSTMKPRRPPNSMLNARVSTR